MKKIKDNCVILLLFIIYVCVMVSKIYDEYVYLADKYSMLLSLLVLLFSIILSLCISIPLGIYLTKKYIK